MEKIGFIGLGIMGKPMSINLINAGCKLVVLDVQKGAVDEVIAKGAGSASTPKEVAEQSDVIITMLPDSPDVEEVVLGTNGLIEGIEAGKLLIDMSTIAPAASKKIYKKLKEKGVESLDAPVSGGDVGAQNGTLSIMVGGTEAAFKRATPLFEAMGKNIVLIGEPGIG